MYRRLTASLLATVALAGACGSGTEPVSSAPDDAAAEEAPPSAAVDSDVVISAVWNTTETGSARTSFHAVVPAGEREIEFGGEGIAQFGDDRGSLTLDITPLLQVSGLATVDGTFETLFEGSTSYLRAPLFDELFSPPSPWLGFHVSELPTDGADTLGDGLRGLARFAGYDAAIGLRLLTGVVDGTVREVGSEVVRGDATTHYTATVRIRSALAATAAPLRERLVQRIGSDEMQVDAFVDESGMVRRVSYLETGGSAGGYPVVLEYFDFGVDEVPTMPADDEVSNLFESVPLF